MAYTLQQIRETVADNLGIGRVDVELDDRHFKRGVDAALKALARWFPMHGYTVMPIAIGGIKYKVPAENILGVLDVNWFNGGVRLEEAPYYTRWVDRMIEMGDMQDTQRIFGDKPEWHWQNELNETTGEDECMLYMSTTRSSFVDTFARLPTHVCVQFAWYVGTSDAPKTGVNRIPYDLRPWVEDFATAKCRVILGEIRGKFSGVPGSSDESILPGDGAEQVARGEAAMRDLLDDLNRRRRQAPLLVD